MHVPVLLNEVMEALKPCPGQIFIDATVGEGGHSEVILKKITPGGKLLGIDLDERAIQTVGERLASFVPEDEIILRKANYLDLQRIAAEEKIQAADGILLDLGFGAHTIFSSGRGFSFLKDEPLDMRYDPESNRLTAAEIVNKWSAERIADVLHKYGEERFSRRIAGNILKERSQKRIETTAELARIIVKSYPRFARSGKIHPATRVFQALRIAVNNELENLEKVLDIAATLLKPGGRMVVISFHSLEDRIVKNFFKNKQAENYLTILTEKPVRPSREEISQNRNSRSAKLRAAEKT